MTPSDMAARLREMCATPRVSFNYQADADAVAQAAEMLERMERALRPFSECAAFLDEQPVDWRAEDDMAIEDALFKDQQPTVGDLRAAAAALGGDQ